MNRVRFVLFLPLIALLALGSAWPGVASAGKADDTLVLAFPSPIPTCDPRDHRVRVAIIRDWNVYDPLLRRDSKTGRLKPGLATSVRALDELTWEVKLRRGVRFHNGEPFNADSVVYTYNSTKDKKQKFKAYGKVKWAHKVIKVDPYTVHFKTKKPFPVVEEFLTAMLMVPPQFAKRVGKKGIARQCMGTGPYKFVSWTKGVKFVGVRNEDYWGKKAPIKNIVIRPIKEPATRIAELIRGGVHIIRQVPPDQIDYINGSGRAVVRNTPILRVVFLRLDTYGRDKKSHPALKDKRVRRAIAHAINMEEIIKHVLKGLALRTATGGSPLAFGYDHSAKPIPYDPQKAKKLLAEAGYPNGFNLTLYSYVGSIVAVRQVVEAIAADLRKVGINSRINIFAAVGQYVRTYKAGKMGDPTVASWGNSSIYDYANTFDPLFGSWSKRSYVKDPEIDRLIKVASGTLDKKVRLDAYKKIQKIMLDNTYWVPMYGQHEVVGVAKDLNFEPAGDEIIRLNEASWK